MTNEHNWNYNDQDECGPNEWPKYYSTGTHQSPINILVDPKCLAYQTATVTCCAGRLKESLYIVKNKNDKPKQPERRQQQHESFGSHLNSIEERKTNLLNSSCTSSPSSSSSSSFSSPSPSPASSSSSSSSSNRSTPTTQIDCSDYFDENDENDDGYSGENNNNNNDCFLKWRNKNGKEKLNENFEKQNTRFCISNKKIFLGYPRYLNSLELTNTGHNWQVNLPKELKQHTLLSGPPFGDREYRLEQFHCHWGENCDFGSEHKINNKSYSAELHFVHWNCKDFKTINEASKHKHGLAVLGVLIQAIDGEQNRNKHLDKIISNLKQVKDKTNSSITISQTRLDLKKLFPTNRWFYASYEGSLTTPPLTEVVDWIVFLNPIQCSTSQIEQFRQLKCPSSTLSKDAKQETNLIKNCRPIQPSNNRLVSIWSHH